MKVLAFRPRRPSRAEILRLVARRRPALAGMTRRASPAGSRAKVGAAAEAIPPATPGNAWPIGRPAVNRTPLSDPARPVAAAAAARRMAAGFPETLGAIFRTPDARCTLPPPSLTLNQAGITRRQPLLCGHV